MDFNEMMSNVKNMAAQMKTMQDDLKSKVAEGAAGGGMVSARMNGAGELVGLEIDPSVIDPEDPEMLADLILAAVSAARKNAEQMKMEGMQEMTGGLDLGAMGINLGDLM